MNPLARTRRLLQEELPGELLIYDRECHRAHCLNRTAALLWRACDGTRDIDALARVLQRETGLPADEELIRLSLTTLDQAGLMERAPLPTASLKRRELFRALGLTGALAALVPALQSGPAAAAGSLGSCIEARKCVPGLTECSPCHNGNVNQCVTKVCRGGNCVNRSAADCDEKAPSPAPAPHSPRPAPKRP